MSDFFKNPQHQNSFRAALKGLKVGERILVTDIINRMADLPGELRYQRAEDDDPALTGEVSTTIGEELDERTFSMSMSSETPYERWWGIEVLGHAPEEADLSWLNSGRAPYLADHDPRTQIGVIKSAELQNRRIVGTVLLGNSDRAKNELADIREGIRSNNSIGYEIIELQLVKEENDVGTYRATKWRPFECSLVSIPADPTVGVGRNKVIPQVIVEDKGEKMSAEQMKRAIEEAQKAERSRIAEISRLAIKHNLRAFGDEHIAEGTALDTFRGLLLDKIGPNTQLDNPINEVGLTDKETRQFSLARYMSAVLSKRASDAPFEMEVAQAVRDKVSKSGVALQGDYPLPYEFMRSPIPGLRAVDGVVYAGNRALNTGSLATGGNVIATDILVSDFATLLRNACLVNRMGARTLSGLVGNVSIPRQIAGTDPVVVKEMSAVAASGSDVLDKVTLSPKSVHGKMQVTREMLRQGSLDIEAFLRMDLLESMAVKRDFLALFGAGGDEPTGLFNTTGVGIVEGGANGAKPTWAHIVDLETRVATQNALSNTLGYLTNAQIRGVLKQTPKFESSQHEIWGAPMTGDEPGLFGTLNGYRVGVSQNIASNLTKGSATEICSGIAFGNWSDLIIGEWGVAEILIDESTGADKRLVDFHVWQMLDVAVRRAQSFALMKDALTA